MCQRRWPSDEKTPHGLASRAGLKVSMRPRRMSMAVERPMMFAEKHSRNRVCASLWMRVDKL